jgi:hypothetical protein
MINFGKMGTSVLRSIVRQNEMILSESYATIEKEH